MVVTFALKRHLELPGEHSSGKLLFVTCAPSTRLQLSSPLGMATAVNPSQQLTPLSSVLSGCLQIQTDHAVLVTVALQLDTFFSHKG